MSDIQLFLLALGAIFIASVILFNWWQERKLHREQGARFNNDAPDVLMDEINHELDDIPAYARKEPHLDEAELVDVQEPYVAEEPLAEIVEPEIHDEIGEINEIDNAIDDEYLPPLVSPETEFNHSPAETFEMPRVTGGLPSAADPTIDLIGVITPATPLLAADLSQTVVGMGEFGKPVKFFAQDNYGAWQYLGNNQGDLSVTKIAATLQLADRTGAASRETILNFQRRIESFAVQIDAKVDWQAHEDTELYANELDAFCVGVDVMVNLHVLVAEGGPFAGTKLRGLAEAGGMTLSDDGAFYAMDDHHVRLFSLTNREQRPFTADSLRTSMIGGVTLGLDFPHTSNPIESFNQMVLLSKKLTQALSAKVVDDNQRPLNDASIEQIRQQLKKFLADMQSRGIEPGGAIAARLFS